MKNWYYSLVLLASYLLVFHFWMTATRNWVIVSGIVTVTVLGLILILVRSRGYFFNDFDAIWHTVVLVDILAEAILVKVHDGYGFYLCALAFSVVIGGYRYWQLKESQKGIPEKIETLPTQLSE